MNDRSFEVQIASSAIKADSMILFMVGQVSLVGRVGQVGTTHPTYLAHAA